jgi:hypothetical protein
MVTETEFRTFQGSKERDPVRPLKEAMNGIVEIVELLILNDSKLSRISKDRLLAKVREVQANSK